MKSTFFWDITLCSPLKVNLCFGGTCYLHFQDWRMSQAPAFMLVSCLAYYSTLKLEAICSSRTSVDFQWPTQRYIPEDNTLHFWISLFLVFFQYEPVLVNCSYRRVSEGLNKTSACVTYIVSVRVHFKSFWSIAIMPCFIINYDFEQFRSHWCNLLIQVKIKGKDS
jgi:hypothetical protein